MSKSKCKRDEKNFHSFFENTGSSKPIYNELGL